MVLTAAAAVAAVLLQRGATASADPAARAVAAGLTAGRFAGVRFANVSKAAAEAQRQHLIAGMGNASARVTVSAVQASGGRAQARLRWTWRLPFGRTWSYTVTVPLDRRSGRWVAVWSPRLVSPALQQGDVLSLAVTQRPRSPILDAEGRPLVVPRPIVNVGVEPRLVRNLSRLVTVLQRTLGIDAAPLKRAIRAAPPTAFVPVITLRRSDYERVRSVIHPLAGTVFTTGFLPLAPTRTFARALLGSVGQPTAALLQQQPSRYAPGELVGLSGLQQAFDRRLGGSPGLQVRVLDRRGAPQRTLYRLAPTAGAALRTTLEPRAQEAADTAVAGAKYATALVAVRISTGGLIADSIAPDAGGYDIGLQGQFPPGSTFKIVTALALLERGETPSDPIACPSQVVVDGKPFHNAEQETLGTITFAHAFAASCNTAFVGLSGKVPGRALPQTARTLGIGEPLALGLPAFAGVVPEPRDSVELAAEAFGQARVLVSPLAMADAAAAVARGRYLQPRLVVGAGFRPPMPAPMLPAVADATLHMLMREVVTDGTATVLASQPGPPVYGKTGTAEVGSATPPRTDAWLVGWQGDIAFAALVANTRNGFGGNTAAPIVGRFLATLAR